jgi:KUP system potassium uptake protein
MITSTFQLLTQVMRLSYFPHIKVVHTSKRFHEQVYMPLANWLLMIGTVIVTAVYNNVSSAVLWREREGIVRIVTAD